MGGDDIVTTRDLPDSLWQSIVEEVVAGKPRRESVRASAAPGASATQAPDPMLRATHAIIKERDDDRTAEAAGTPERRMVKAGVVDDAARCAKAAMEWAMARATGDEEAAQLYEAEFKKYGTCDVRWVECVTAYAEHFQVLGRTVPYVADAYDLPTEQLQRKATIAIFGDWGTGGTNAIEVMRQIKAFRPDILLHLGDVYYSGTQSEMQSRFLEPIDEVFEGARPMCLSLCGNHDVYSGGDGYYWLISQLGQRASYFALENEDWLLIGMDTGQSDFNPHAVDSTAASLREAEAAWVNRLVAAKGRKKVVLFSHHPLFSAYDAIDDKPWNELLRGQLSASIPMLTAWFWGHEHRLGTYDRHLNLAKGRCLGHAAIPVPDDGTGDPPKFGDVPVHLEGGQPVAVGSDEGLYRNGFAILSLEGPTASVKYYSRGIIGPVFSEHL